MAEFNKACVNFVEDEDLYGKYGYFSDNIDSLEMSVTENNHKCYGQLAEQYTTKSAFPFMREDDGEFYRFFYYDPSLDISIQSSRTVTYRELTHWLAQGNGEGRYSGRLKLDEYCFCELRYKTSSGDYPVQNIVVRKWDDSEWHPPTADYLGLDN